MSWDIDQERTFIENILCQRFNFLLVFFSVVVAGAVSANDAFLSSAVLTIGAVVCTPLAFTIARAQRRHNYMMEELVYSDPKHVATKVRDALENTGGVPSMRNWIGYWIPLICDIGLWLGACCGWSGLLFQQSSSSSIQGVQVVPHEAASEGASAADAGKIAVLRAIDIPAWITAIAAIAAMFAIVVAVRTFRFEAWIKAQSLFTEDEFTKARGKVFELESPVDYHQLQQDEELLDAAKLVCRRLDELAHLFDQKVLPMRRARRCWDIAFSKALIVLEPYVEERRRKDHNANLWQDLVSVATGSLRRTGYPWDIANLDVDKLGNTARRVLHRELRNRPSTD